MNIDQSISLLIDGKEAFEEILRCVDRAERSILINMFIWRDDEIGNEVARAVLNAADRGVKVSISVDRVGMVLELCEEYERSFFHRAPSLSERVKIAALRIFYPQNRAKASPKLNGEELLDRMLSHPNVSVEREIKKADHSKYYIFDDSVLIFGGVNIEEKERSKDCTGRVYQDYMIKMNGEEHVKAFVAKLKGEDISDQYKFRMNNKNTSPASFEMLDAFLDIINRSQKELVIVMAYFTPSRDIVKAIVEAWRRGVQIRILIPEKANFQNDSNRKAVYKIMRRCRNEIQVVLSPKMVHTKLIYSERSVMLGSCNITRRAFEQLGELDLELKNDDSIFVDRLKKSVVKNFWMSKKISNCSQINYNSIFAFIEGRLN